MMVEKAMRMMVEKVMKLNTYNQHHLKKQVVWQNSPDVRRTITFILTYS